MERRVFGHMDGQAVEEVVLEHGPTRIALLNYGCVVRDWRLQGRPMVLGFERFEDYVAHSPSMGIIAGRVANRIAGGRFVLDGVVHQLDCNLGPNHLHGGVVGLGRRIWAAETDSAANAVRFSYHSPDGEDRYPGAVDFTAIFTLGPEGLFCQMEAVPDRVTPVNLAQHSYYNLGAPTIMDHVLRVPASRYTELGPELIPTGRILPVDGTRFDFRAPRRIGAADPEGGGHDINLVLDPGRAEAEPAAEAWFGDRHLAIWTDEPGMQLYTSGTMAVPVPGLDGQRYPRFGGLCLEAQHFPDAVNQPGFPSILRSPDQPYCQRLLVRIT